MKSPADYIWHLILQRLTIANKKEKKPKHFLFKQILQAYNPILGFRQASLLFAKIPIKYIFCFFYFYYELNSFSFYPFNMHITRNRFAWIYCILF